MAFRAEKAVGAFVVALLTVNVTAAAEQVTIPVRHTHMRKGGAGELEITPAGISFREAGKKNHHSRAWAYEDIQELSVAPDMIRILTYEDVRWQLNKDRQYEFDHLPEGSARRVLDALRGRMDERRVVVAMPDLSLKPLWQVKVKLLQWTGGSEGVLLVGEDSIVYNSAEREASRTWHFSQIDNISSSGPFDLTITTFEQAGSRYAGRRDFRFQLKTELAEEKYNALWHRLNDSRLLRSSTNNQTREN